VIFAVTQRQSSSSKLGFIPMKITAVLPLTPQTTVADTLDAFPQTISVFLNHQMICVGCAMAEFDTLEEAAKNYSIPTIQLLDELHDEISKSTPT
jgi:hybrid cluster-associated redox disulfide protein